MAVDSRLVDAPQEIRRMHELLKRPLATKQQFVSDSAGDRFGKLPI
jgi:hypothetical protein